VLEDAHRQAALELEHLIDVAGDPAVDAQLGRGLIELYWGAAFHWVAYGCQRKHGKHKETHAHLVSYLREIGELGMSDVWNLLDDKRRWGWYGHHTSIDDVTEMRGFWQDVRSWATS
jgi:hypothetical protein